MAVLKLVFSQTHTWLQRKITPIEIGTENTVAELKTAYQHAEGVPASKQRLLLRGQEIGNLAQLGAVG